MHTPTPPAESHFAALGTTAGNKKGELESIRRILVVLLNKCQVPFDIKGYDQALHDKCMGVAHTRGYPVGSDPTGKSLLPFLPTGVYMASLSYPHLEADSTHVYIALYTAFVTYLDDLFKSDVDSVIMFHSRLMRSEVHNDPVIDAFARLLKETNLYFDQVAANMIVTDALEFINSLILENEVAGVNICDNAVRLPGLLRFMSGLPTAYTMYIFPAKISLQKYLQAIPEIRNFICYMNDVLSFYKEEIRGESDNFISLFSLSQNLDKITTLETLANDVAKSNDTVKAILSSEPEALQAWETFVSGHIYFYTSNARYKLESLNL